MWLLVMDCGLIFNKHQGVITMLIEQQNIIETGDAAYIHYRKGDPQVIFESGNVYQMYGRKNEKKLRLIGTQKAPNFSQWDNYYFQKTYSYLGIARVVKAKRTLKLYVNKL